MDKRLLLLLLIIPIIIVSGCISIQTPQTNNMTSSQQYESDYKSDYDKVLKSCLESKSSPLDYTIDWMSSCNVGNECSIIFKNDIYLRQIPSGSMCPSQFIGEFAVFMKIDDKNNLKIGDIINWQKNGLDIAHRIVSTCKDGYITRGDFLLNQEDGCIKYNEIVGVEVATIKSIK